MSVVLMEPGVFSRGDGKMLVCVFGLAVCGIGFLFVALKEGCRFSFTVCRQSLALHRIC